MGSVYKDKKGSSCAMCKPHKNGWTPKFKDKERQIRKQLQEEIEEIEEMKTLKLKYKR